MPLFFKVGILEILSIAILFIFLRIFLGLLSKAAAMSNPYILKPGYANIAEPKLPTPTKATL
jgi:hypothetical protein